MAKRKKPSAGDPILQIQTATDRLGEWVAANPRLVIGVLALILAGAASYGGYTAWSDSREDAASAAFTAVQRDFLEAMGGDPTSPQWSAPANPEIGRRARAEAAERYREVAAAHRGTGVVPLAHLEAGDLLAALEDGEAARSEWLEAIEVAGSSSPLRGLALTRLAVAHESAGRWLDAAHAHEDAGDIERYPPRYQALAQAARCYGNAGETARALALFERVEQEAPGVSIPAHIRARMAELRAESAPDYGPEPSDSVPTTSDNVQ